MIQKEEKLLQIGITVIRRRIRQNPDTGPAGLQDMQNHLVCQKITVGIGKNN
jgi:hypothetical protein